MLKVLEQGLFTTLQDQGRFGFKDKGVPVSGSMDTYTTKAINTLLENASNAAVLEITMTGPTLEFKAPTYICIGGANFVVALNNEPISLYKIYKVKAGDVLSYGKLNLGFRGYLGIKGGFKSTVILNSSSYYYPITKSRCVKKGEELDYEECQDFNPKISEIKISSILNKNILEIAKGPEYNLLNPSQIQQIFTTIFSISNQNDRMAYQLQENIEGISYSMLTSATFPGTIQLTPSGKLIILMKDGQTTGGYPRILQLTDRAICVLAQKKYGDTVRFKLV
ncbi:biotin-dependent carboxyltransferase family protein [uncultured Maribacter sp.]|uniref:5-oxoprolinase subunit C family protein n=1 Tax=uncultured Maribacter sp. TaxID=431308 RepID=UPI002602A014|nr:biotin-dependent carboxyltransferase family protein [uncultured Maribacter sp.]